MPLYEYECKKCHKTFDVLQKIDADPLEKCIHCNGKVEKLISVSSFQFKGSGWYITDYKNKKAKTETSTNNTNKDTNAATNKNAAIK